MNTDIPNFIRFFYDFSNKDDLAYLINERPNDAFTYYNLEDEEKALFLSLNKKEWKAKLSDLIEKWIEASDRRLPFEIIPAGYPHFKRWDPSYPLPRPKILGIRLQTKIGQPDLLIIGGQIFPPYEVKIEIIDDNDPNKKHLEFPNVKVHQNSTLMYSWYELELDPKHELQIGNYHIVKIFYPQTSAKPFLEERGLLK